jgi:hypothetical protein
MGGNWEGELGDGTYNQHDSPVEILSTGVQAVAAGDYHSLFVKTDGSLWAMGEGDFGELGDGTTNGSLVPEYVASNVKVAAAGTQFSLMLTNGNISSEPVITSQPANKAVTVGGSATFTVVATGAPPPAFQWQVSADGGASWLNVITETDGSQQKLYTGESTATLTVTAPPASMSGYEYRCLVTTGTDGLTSSAARLTVTKHSQTISFPAPANTTYGAQPQSFPLQATATSGLPVTVTLVSGPAELYYNYLTITGAGTVKVAANQAGNASYAAAPQVERSFTVAKEAQTITFPVLGNTTLSASPINLFAYSSSGLTVAFTVKSGPATVSGTTLKLTGSGTVTVQAIQAGNANISAAAPVSRTFTVAM